MDGFVLDASVAISWCDEADIHEYLRLLESLPIRVVSGGWLQNIGLESLARKHHLAAYDAAYLDLALREKLPLATLDQDLKRAALSAPGHSVSKANRFARLVC